MSDLARLLLFLGFAGAMVTFMGSAVLWFGDEERRMRRALNKVLKGQPEALIIARGRGRGAGFNFQAGAMAVTWDRGGWCLVYRLEELMGGELHVDGQVVAAAFRGEGRKPLQQVAPKATQVTLRLIFDDARHPDFDLDLWEPGDENQRDAGDPADAIRQANQWLTRIEAILRRPLAGAARASSPVPPPQPAAPAPPPPPVTPPRPAARAPAAPVDEDAPPWQPDLLDDEDDPDRDEHN